jgi:hypothetical protein
MSTATAVESKGTSKDFGADDLVLNAVSYRANKAIVDAASKYDNVEDAITGLRHAWSLLESQAENGAGFTPDVKLGFGSDNARVIAESLMGVRNTVGSTRKAFKDLGKV